MTRNDKPSVFIKSTPLQVKKIEVKKKSIQEPVTRKDIIDGMIDSGYVVALKTLYDAGLANKKDFEKSLAQIPDYILDVI